MTVAAGVTLRLAPAADGDTADDGATRTAVLDTTWAPAGAMRPRAGATLAPAGSDPIALRAVAGRVLAGRDLIVEAVQALNGWARASGVVDAMSVDGTSYWYYTRLGHWMWLEEQILWVAILSELVREVDPAAITCAAGTDQAAVEAARLIAARDGLAFEIEPAAAPAEAVASDAATPRSARAPRGAAAANAAAGVAPLPEPTATLRQRVDHLRLRLLGRIRQTDPRAARRYVQRRLNRLAKEPGRLLVVLEHARQRVETPGGPRFMNPYLGPVVERLRGTRLAPIEIDIRLRLAVESTWLRLNEWGSERLLPSDAVWIAGAPWDDNDDYQRQADAIGDRVAETAVPVEVDGVDLGPALTARVASEARRSLASQLRGATRNRALLRTLKPAGLLLADEYHRQAWLAAARAEGIPTAAIQHGMIYRWHNGYVHMERPPDLRLPDRTYVFGRWEREVLVDHSVYRPDEVVVGGSPRLDLVRNDADGADVRRELNVAHDARLIVVSGTWGRIYRRFHYPIGLAALFDRPLPNVHVVVKLHPGEPDEGPYRAVIEGAAQAGGFEPPPITVVQSIDLYRLLAAADAHIGIHSTVLTEAVAAGTPNLLVDGLAGSDLLGYVEAGVAHPVRTGADLLDALDRGRGRATPEAREAFLAAHFEPGNATERIADDLLAWL